MKNHKTVENLEKILVESYALALKTQNYHWNIVGENFKSLHELFGMQYDELALAIDEVAERMRQLGAKVEATFEHFAGLRKAKNGDKNLDARGMVKDLEHDNEALSKALKSAIKAAQDEGDEGTADLLIAREKAHDKAAWMLQSSL